MIIIDATLEESSLTDNPDKRIMTFKMHWCSCSDFTPNKAWGQFVIERRDLRKKRLLGPHALRKFWAVGRGLVHSFHIETIKNGEWTPRRMLLQTVMSTWPMAAYRIQLDGSSEQPWVGLAYENRVQR